MSRRIRPTERKGWHQDLIVSLSVGLDEANGRSTSDCVIARRQLWVTHFDRQLLLLFLPYWNERLAKWQRHEVSKIEPEVKTNEWLEKKQIVSITITPVESLDLNKQLRQSDNVSMRDDSFECERCVLVSLLERDRVERWLFFQLRKRVSDVQLSELGEGKKESGVLSKEKVRHQLPAKPSVWIRHDKSFKSNRDSRMKKSK